MKAHPIFAAGFPRKTSLGMLLLLVALFFSNHAVALEPAPPKITGLFSDMTFHSDTGDVLGMEVFLVYSNRGYIAIYQSSEGEPSVPIVLPAKVNGNAVSFQIPPEVDGRGSFVGTVSNNELVGSFSGNGQRVHLKRKPSYWQ